LSTASGDVVRKRGGGARRPVRPITWAILALVAVAAFGTMFIVLFNFWPTGGGVTEPPVGSVTPTSHLASGVLVEKASDPVRQGDQVIMKVKITNQVKQSPVVTGTPTPNAATPVPEEAKVYNVTVKVLYYDKAATEKDKKIVGSGIGNYFNPQGLAYGQSATIDVVSTGVGDFKDFEIFPDTVWTDKDPIKPQTPTAP
jgi:hypothetical protein